MPFSQKTPGQDSGSVKHLKVDDTLTLCKNKKILRAVPGKSS